MLDIVILAIKIVATSLSGFFGVIGTIHDFRSKSGQVTPWGKLALWGLSVSLFCAISAQLFEGLRDQISARRAAEEAIATTQRMEALLNDVNRSLHPITSFRVFVSGLQPDTDDIAGYVERILPTLEEHSLASSRGEFIFDPNVNTVATVSEAEQSYIASFELHGDLLPTPNDVSAYRLLRVHNAELAIYSDPIDPGLFSPFCGGCGPEADLNVDLSPNRGDFMAVGFDVPGFGMVAEGAIELGGALRSESSEFWDTNSTIIAVPDLRGTQVFIAFGPLGMGGDQTNELFLEERARFSLHSLNFQVNNRSIWLDDLTKHTNDEGITFWEFRLPDANDPFRETE